MKRKIIKFVLSLLVDSNQYIFVQSNNRYNLKMLNKLSCVILHICIELILLSAKCLPNHNICIKLIIYLYTLGIRITNNNSNNNDHVNFSSLCYKNSNVGKSKFSIFFLKCFDFFCPLK